MSGKVGFWRWLLLKIWKGIKTIPKLPKILKDTEPEFEMTLTPLAFLLGLLIGVFCYSSTIGLLLGVAFALLLYAHAHFRMEGDC